ncbi:KRAB-A domain-containing protein 2-like [Galleria mellonella]|uniref:KRAB-A domain-containing protein 2-like n=1 Tax=Galleria mellonella TaxID=7137 RepID=A0ABM3MI52_GALME|nr:KRAB-A domain-containing protein 2-like [Galleria mellonella]XP_052751037.1 KRAB-A domain-containing protein 2-like [Galleria mellonella]XP_052751038.1 KRAB-A domain-containing protein 2-like [Galleria mellonella]XP_052751039.1 KRAB-A domain-containing protein 2-like [Galleria mellonella]
MPQRGRRIVFNYDSARKNYLQRIRIFYKNNSVSRKDRSSLDHVIKDILSEGQHSKFAKKYEVVKENGKKILILRRTEKSRGIIQVIPPEECFDILVDVHRITGHCYSNMMKVINKYYSIPSFCVNLFFREVIKSISTNDSLNNKDNKDHTQVEIIDMSKEPDGKFTKILLYHNKRTDFIVLKPIMNNDPNEVALELLNIFLDFGTPAKLFLLRVSFLFFNEVLDVLKQISPNFEHLVVETTRHYNMKFQTLITKSLDIWMTTCGSKNWSIACHVLQWKLNTRKLNDEGKTPYTNMFGPWPSKCELVEKDSSQFTDNIIEKFRSEKDPGVINVDPDDEINKNLDTNDTVMEIDDDSNSDASNENVNIDDNDKEEMVSLDEINTDNISQSDDVDPLGATLEPVPSTSKQADDNTDSCCLCKKRILIAHECGQCKKPLHRSCGKTVSADDSVLISCEEDEE